MLVTLAVEYFIVNNAPQIEALIFPFLINKLNFVVDIIFDKFSSNVKATLVKNGKKTVKVGYEYTLIDAQNREKVSIFRFMIKIFHSPSYK